MLKSDTQAVILGLSINGAAALRRLTRVGYSVAGVTDDGGAIGLHSRFGQKLKCPDPRRDLDAWVEFMLRIGEPCSERPALIPASDHFVLAMDEAADRLAPAFKFHGFGSGLRSKLTSKRDTFELARQAEFPMRKTRVVGNREALLEFCRDIAWPALIKPNFSFNWQSHAAIQKLQYKKVLTASTPEELMNDFAEVMRFSPDAIVQELIPGPDSNLLYWAGFVSAEGEVCGRIIGRKLRVTPAHFGSASFVQLVDMPELEALCEDFIVGQGFQGLCGVELKIDERDGQAKLIEVNPRLGLWEDIGIPVGVDLVHEAVTALHGGRVIPRRARSFKQKWVHLGRDLRAFREYRAEGAIGLFRWLGSLTPPIVVSDLPRTDIPYAVSNLREIIGSVASKFRRGRRRSAESKA